MRLDRDGMATLDFMDGPTVVGYVGGRTFRPQSSLSASTYLPGPSLLHLETIRDDHILVEIARPENLGPMRGRTSVYLDQNHWSTLSNAIHEPARVVDSDERDAALRLIDLALSQQVVLPFSGAHLGETCRQLDPEARYRRALTMAQLSAGWQLRDPLVLRQFELRQAMTVRYRGRCLIPAEAVTLEPGAVGVGQCSDLDGEKSDLRPGAQWVVHAITCISAVIDTLLDGEPVPFVIPVGWSEHMERFARFLRDNPSGKELKRRRTHVKFLADLGRELPEAAWHVGLSRDELGDWTLHRSEEDLASMPTLGLCREVLHEKLADSRLRWHNNDLIDMMYLTAAAAHGDFVAGERAHISYVANALQRLGRQKDHVYHNLRSLVPKLELCRDQVRDSEIERE
jgi:hypothetical protein